MSKFVTNFKEYYNTKKFKTSMKIKNFFNSVSAAEHYLNMPNG